MHKMANQRKQPNFKSAIIFIVGLAVINGLIILLNTWLHSDVLTFFGNVIGAGFLFPATLLYIDRQEKFHWKRYLLFAIEATIVFGIVTYLFIVRF